MSLNQPRGGFSVDTLRTPLVALGVFALLAGAATGLVGGVPDWLPRAFFAAGILLLGIYVALDPEAVWAKITGRSAIYSGNTVAIAVAAIFILGLLNVLGSRYQTKVDLTADRKSTRLNSSHIPLSRI